MVEEGWKIKQQKPKARGSFAPPGCVSLYVFVIFLHIGIKDKKKEQRMPNSAIRTKTSEKEDGGTAEYFRLMALAKKMVPVVENIETVVPKKADAAVLLIKAETPVTTEESGQLRFC